MLSFNDIQSIFIHIADLRLNYRFGYAGSYARGEETEESDRDIVILGDHEITPDDFWTLFSVLKKIVPIKFDMIELGELKKEDERFDKRLIELGLEVNESSAYKTICRDVIWMV